MRLSRNSWKNVIFSKEDCKEEKKIIDECSIGASKGYFNNLLGSDNQVAQPKTNPVEKTLAPSSSKSRLKKDTFIAYKDLESSPLKTKPSKHARSKIRTVTKEDEEEMNHLVNITKEAKEYKPPEPDVFQKPMRKIKTNKSQRFQDIQLKSRSPPKVAMHLRVPLCDRNYSFRNRDGLKMKDTF